MAVVCDNAHSGMPRGIARAAARVAACLLCGALPGLQAQAATVQVQLLDAASRPLPGAVVFLESREARLAAKPAQGVEIAQVSKQFEPTVTVVPLGTWIQFPNRDTVRHHVYSFSPAKTFELKLYTGTSASPVLFDRSGVAVLGCNIHDNMAAWVVVVETPYYGRANSSGSVSLTNVPAGNYRLRAWHPAMPVGAPALDLPLAVGSEPVQASVRVPVTP